MTSSSSVKTPSTDRWWAPQRATISPDAVVLAMLEPGDLGSAMLAVHRAGAAAIDTVARSAVPSEAALVDAMVRARAQVADKVVDSVSKSATPSYAGLFVMDVFDDAEQGALSIYRTAVTKGVSPSVAAKRAGDVFGVPAKLMGKYAPVATDPKSNSGIVQALADRTLLEHVSHVVAVEAPAPVAKADEGAYQRAPGKKQPWQESDVMRDAFGQFAPEPGNEPPPGSLESIRRRLNLSGAPSQVAGEPVKEQAAPQRRVRRTRKVRRTRTVSRETAERTATERQVGTRSAGAREAGQRRMADRQQIARQVNQAARKTIETNAKRALVGPVMTFGDMLAEFPNHRNLPYYELDHEVVLRMDLKTGASFRGVAEDQSNRFKEPDTTVFRIGHLLRAATNTTPERPGSIHDTTNRETLALGIHEEGDNAWPDADIVNAVDLSMSRRSEQDFVEEERAKKAKEKTAEWTKYVHGIDEDANTLALPVYRPYGWDEDDDSPDQQGNWAIVHFPPTDPRHPHKRDLPTVEEFILLGSPRGSHEGTPSQPSLELDPNQAYEIAHPPGAPRSGMRMESFWDKENSVIVNRWYLRAISDTEVEDMLGEKDVGKAEQYAYRPRPSRAWQESEVMRDAFGRFAEEPDEAQQEETVEGTRAIRERRVRRTRKTRKVAATAAPTRAVAAREAAGGSQVERQTGTRAVGQRAVVARSNEQEELAPLSDIKDYKVFTEKQWHKVIQYLDDAEQDQLFNGYEAQLDSMTRRAFAEAKVHDVHELYDRMALNVDNDASMRSKQFKALAHLPVAQARDTGVLADYLYRLFRNHPEVNKVEMIRYGDTIRFWGNIEPARDQSIIEADKDIDWDQPVYLHYVGEYRVKDLEYRTHMKDIESLINMPNDVEGVVANPTVHLYRVSTRHWRAKN